jgi:hypothetical protein
VFNTGARREEFEQRERAARELEKSKRMSTRADLDRQKREHLEQAERKKRFVSLFGLDPLRFCLTLTPPVRRWNTLRQKASD